MNPKRQESAIALRRWSDEDLHILEETPGDATMMEHLGGIETADQIASRHKRYLAEHSSDRQGMFTIVLRAESAVVGSVGFWETTWQGERIYEAGWMVLPRYAGRRIATRAASEIVSRARAQSRYRYLHAFPSVWNVASNAVCRNVGFTSLGERDFEYPKGHIMRCNNWRVDVSS